MPDISLSVCQIDIVGRTNKIANVCSSTEVWYWLISFLSFGKMISLRTYVVNLSDQVSVLCLYLKCMEPTWRDIVTGQENVQILANSNTDRLQVNLVPMLVLKYPLYFAPECCLNEYYREFPSYHLVRDLLVWTRNLAVLCEQRANQVESKKLITYESKFEQHRGFVGMHCEESKKRMDWFPATYTWIFRIYVSRVIGWLPVLINGFDYLKSLVMIQ